MESISDNNLFHRSQVNDNTGKQILNSQLIPTFTDYRGNNHSRPVFVFGFTFERQLTILGRVCFISWLFPCLVLVATFEINTPTFQTNPNENQRQPENEQRLLMNGYWSSGWEPGEKSKFISIVGRPLTFLLTPNCFLFDDTCQDFV